MVLCPSLEGNRAVQPAAIQGYGVPPASFQAGLGQFFFDFTVTPPLAYQYNGQTWVTVSGGAVSFTSLTVTGNATIGGNETVAGTFTATGNITTTAGNLQATGVGQGLVLTPTVVAAGASPQVANGRVVSVTFNTVSIAAGATQAFTITNSAITGATTLLDITMVGTTSGSAPTVQSVVNSLGQSVITVTNGTGATTQTGNLTFTILVLN